MKNVLITGACGYLGANIASVLAENGFSLTAFDLAMPEKNPEWEKKMDRLIIGDIRNQKTLDELGRHNFDAIVHLISLDHRASQGNPEQVMEVNVQPVWNILDLFKGKNLKTFIYFSTQQVLGKFATMGIDEHSPARPLNHYGLTHLLGEQLVSYYDRISEINCINIRLSNGYGPPVFKGNNCWWLVVNDLCKTAFEKGKIVLQSDGTPQRDFIYVEDIGLAVKYILENNEVASKSINIGSGLTYTILELAHLVKKVYKSLYSTEIDIILGDGSISGELTPTLQTKFLWKTDELSKLGYSPKTDLEKGIHSMFKYLEKAK